jgi:hypothetical protein
MLSEQSVPTSRGVYWQTLSTQLASTHGLALVQSATVAHSHSPSPPMHAPLRHVSPLVQLSPSSQGVASAAGSSRGQTMLTPVQCSSASHAPLEARHTTELAANTQLNWSQHVAKVLSTRDLSHCSPLSRTPLPHKLWNPGI